MLQVHRHVSGTLLLEDTGTVDCAKTCGLKKKDKILNQKMRKKNRKLQFQIVKWLLLIDTKVKRQFSVLPE